MEEALFGVRTPNMLTDAEKVSLVDAEFLRHEEDIKQIEDAKFREALRYQCTIRWIQNAGVLDAEKRAYERKVARYNAELQAKRDEFKLRMFNLGVQRPANATDSK